MNASLNLLTLFFPPESLCFSSFRLKTDFKAAFFTLLDGARRQSYLSRVAQAVPSNNRCLPSKLKLSLLA